MYMSAARAVLVGSYILLYVFDNCQASRAQAEAKGQWGVGGGGLACT